MTRPRLNPRNRALPGHFYGVLGRLNQRDWRKEGLEPVFPDDWHYALRLLPHALTDSETQKHAGGQR